MKPLPHALIVATFLVPLIPLHAGICSAASEPRNEFGFFAGYSPASSTLIGTATDRRFIVAGFTYEYHCWMWNSISLGYTATAMPAAILLQPSQELYSFLTAHESVIPAHAVYGFAVAPLGFTIEFIRARRFHPFAETIEGLIASTEPIPENQPNATGLNFMFDLGAGVRWDVGSRQAVILGYRFLHISNADTTGFNPGVDNNVFYLGYSFLR